MNPLLSICIPSYNRAKYIQQTLDSIINQNISNQIEVIISDNASTDDTESIIKIYIAKYSFIKYYKNSVNIGADANFYNVASYANGDYIWWVCSDDVLENSSIERLLLILTLHESAIYYLWHNLYSKDLSNNFGAHPFLKEFNHNIFVGTGGIISFGFMLGFIGALVIQKQKFNQILHPLKFNGTNYVHVAWVMELCLKNNMSIQLLNGSYIKHRLGNDSFIDLNNKLHRIMIDVTGYHQIGSYYLSRADFNKFYRKVFEKHIYHPLLDTARYSWYYYIKVLYIYCKFFLFIGLNSKTFITLMLKPPMRIIKKYLRSYLICRKLKIYFKRIPMLVKLVIIDLYKVKHSKSISDVCLIRVDAIGDFILWLQSAKYYRQLYPDKNITLICNIQYISLANNISFFNNVIGVDVPKLNNLYYLKNIISVLIKTQYNILICDMYSRVFTTSDILVYLIRAKHKIGIEGSLANIAAFQKNISNRWYTQIIEIPDQKFEINNHMAFINKISATPIKFEFSNILDLFKSKYSTLNVLHNRPFIIVNVGSSNIHKNWPMKHFIELINTLSNIYDVILIGSLHESLLLEQYINDLNTTGVINLINKTNLIELVLLISQATLVISNDSAVAHIAAGVNTSSIVILGGGHFGRFMPYTISQQWNFPIPIYETMPCFNCNWHCIYPLESNQPYPCIKNIDLHKVLNEVNHILGLKKYMNIAKLE